MARRDVDLVIRAKDESTKAVDSIVKALNELVSGIGDAEKKVDAGDSAFSKLGKSLGTLDKAMRGMSSAERLGKQLDAAAASSARLEVQVTQTAQDLERLSGELSDASTLTALYREEVGKTAATLEREKTALKETQTAHAAVAKQLTSAKNDRAQLETAERKLATAIETQTERLAKQEARLASVAEQLNSVETPTKRLTASFDAAGAAVVKTTEQIEETRAKLAQTRAALETAATAEAEFGNAVSQSKAALDTRKKSIADLKAAYADHSATARQAAAAERQLDGAFKETASSLANQQTGVSKAGEALQELRTNVERAEQSVAELAQAAKGPLSEAFRAQQAVVSRVNNAFQQNRQDLAALSALMGQVGVPTRAMADAMARLNTINRETATEYRTQQNVLRTLRGELGQTATTTTELAAKQDLFATAINEGAAALGRVTAEVNSASTATQKIISANEKAARSYREVAASTKTADTAADGLVSANDKVAESYRRQANASRQSMSYVQRLRGEVLSLISSYGGLYAVINVLDQAVKSYQKLEAAQSRLNAITGGNQTEAAQELDFLRRTADRLGIEFGTLADEYTKFAASTKNTVLEGQKTRDVFLAIAEAGTVNRLSLDDMGGILKAVTQIASKGKIQLEELTGQLGDRLPGALQILADGLHITTEELLDLTKNGEVTSASLVNFAEELNKRYGKALGTSLLGTTVLLGQLQNAATQALLAFANGGFIDGFNELLRKLTATMKSADFQEFAANAGSAFGTLAKALGVLADNFQLAVAGATAFGAAIVIPAAIRFGTSLLTTAGILGKVSQGTAVVSQGIAGAGTAAATAATRVTLLTRAFQALTLSTGIGIALTAISVGIAYWSTRADEASLAMQSHRSVVDEVKNAYDRAGGAAGNWADKIKETTKLDVTNNLAKVTAQLNEARKNYTAEIPFKGLIKNEDFQELERLDAAFRDGKMSVADFRKALSDLYDKNDDEGLRDQIQTMSDAAKEVSIWEKAAKEADLTFKALFGAASEKSAAMRELNGAIDAGATALDEAAAAAKKYEESLDKIKELVPELKAELDRLKDLKTLTGEINNIDPTKLTPDGLQTILSAGDAIQVKFDDATQKALKEAFTTATEGNKALLTTAAQFDGFNENNPTQNNALSEFFKAANINIDPKMTAWCAAFVNATLATNGMPSSTALNARSFLDYGSATTDPKPGDIVVLKRGKNDDKGHVGFFMGYAPDGGVKVLGGNQGGGEKVSTSTFAGADVLGFRRPPTAAEAETERAKNSKATAEAIAGNAAQIAQQELINAGKEREAAIQKAITDAKKENPKIGAEELAQISEQAGKLYDLENAQKIANKPKEAAQKAEDAVNQLLQRQQALRAQLAIYQQQGDVGGIASTKTALEGVNTELTAAIDNATKMWEAVGGTEAAAKIETLKQAKLEAEQLAKAGDGTTISWRQVGEVFANHLVNAFDQFAQSVAEGMSIGEAARNAFLQFASDFLIEIGQMILKQALFNFLRGLGGPFAGLGLSVGAGHSGGVVGSARIGGGNQARKVNAGLFAAAPRFHSGTAAPLGLRANEVPAILKKNEEVLAENDPRNILNGGAAAQPGSTAGGNGSTGLRIFNLFDAADVTRLGLSSAPGEEGVMNIIKTNRGTIKDIMDNG